MITLRPYQKEPVRKAVEFFRQDNPEPSLMVLPTAWGKSILAAEAAAACPDPILVVQPTKELLEQNLSKYRLLCGDLAPAGVYSASFGKRQIDHVTFATIGSIKNEGARFRELGFRKMLIDEAHLYPRKEQSMLGEFLRDSGIRQVLGITATPLKLESFSEKHGKKFDKWSELIMLTNPEWTEKMTKAYEAYYGKAWESADFETASYQWIDGFLKNVNYTFTSASKIATGIASGAAGNMGIFVFSKLRKVADEDRPNLTVLQFENDVDCFSGFMYNVYATVCKDTDCPYTCALFINWLLSEEGFGGPKSWNSSQGYYSPNTTIDKPEGVEDQAYTYWKDKLVFEDLNYIDGLGEAYNDIYRFINVRVSK